MIGCDQVGEVLRALGLNPLAAEIKKLVKELDPDGKFVMHWCHTPAKYFRLISVNILILIK